MEATHRLENSLGHTYYGVFDGVNFLCLCDDLETWMKEPVDTWGCGVRRLKTGELDRARQSLNAKTV